MEFLFEVIPMKNKILLTAMMICLAAFGFAAYQFYQYYAEDAKAARGFDVLIQVIEQTEPSGEDGSSEAGQTDENSFSAYQQLSILNEDMVGWIKIEDTTINYPVMHTPNDPEYYLKHDFDGTYSNHGVPFLDANCTLDGDNLIIYGHHIRGQKMFGALMDYTNEDFYKSHSIIHFDTLTETGQYQIIAIFKAQADGAFRYYDFTHAATKEAFDSYVSEAKARSLYETGYTAKYGEQLLTLSTCEYSQNNGRLVVVAKKLISGSTLPF